MNRRGFLKRALAGAALAATASYAPSLLKRDEAMTFNGVPIRCSQPLTLAEYARDMDPNGPAAKIAQTLSQSNDILADVAFKPIEMRPDNMLDAMREAMTRMSTHGSAAVFYASPKTVRKLKRLARPRRWWQLWR